MKKILLSMVVVAVLAVAFFGVSTAFAQTPTPGTSGYGMGAGRGMRGGIAGAGLQGTQSGILHDEIVAAFAQKLGLTVDEINTRLANGETLSQIAASKGYTFDQFTALMVEARTQAIDAAVKAGTLTQAQADWMKTRGMFMNGQGRFGQGAGQGRFANPSCPYYNQTTP